MPGFGRKTISAIRGSYEGFLRQLEDELREEDEVRDYDQRKPDRNESLLSELLNGPRGDLPDHIGIKADGHELQLNDASPAARKES